VLGHAESLEATGLALVRHSHSRCRRTCFVVALLVAQVGVWGSLEGAGSACAGRGGVAVVAKGVGERAPGDDSCPALDMRGFHSRRTNMRGLLGLWKGKSSS
jgi:hypothetical protein